MILDLDLSSVLKKNPGILVEEALIYDKPDECWELQHICLFIPTNLYEKLIYQGFAFIMLSSSDRKIYQPPMCNCALSIITLHPFSITPQGHPVIPVCELPPPFY